MSADSQWWEPHTLQQLPVTDIQTVYQNRFFYLFRCRELGSLTSSLSHLLQNSDFFFKHFEVFVDYSNSTDGEDGYMYKRQYNANRAAVCLSVSITIFHQLHNLWDCDYEVSNINCAQEEFVIFLLPALLEFIWSSWFYCWSTTHIFCAVTWGGMLIMNADPSGRAVYGVGLQPLICRERGFESRRGHGWFLLWVLCVCQVEVSATSWSLVQRSPTDCGASLCVTSEPPEWGGSNS